MFEIGALRYERLDFFLWAPQSATKESKKYGGLKGTNGIEDAFLLELPQLGSCPLQVEAGLIRDTSHLRSTRTRSAGMVWRTKPKIVLPWSLPRNLVLCKASMGLQVGQNFLVGHPTIHPQDTRHGPATVPTFPGRSQSDQGVLAREPRKCREISNAVVDILFSSGCAVPLGAPA